MTTVDTIRVGGADGYDVLIGSGLMGRLLTLLGETVRRVLVLRPGSGVCLEESITADNRHDPARRQDLHDRIAAVMEYDL